LRGVCDRATGGDGMFERVNGGGSLRVRDPRAMTDAELREAREIAAGASVDAGPFIQGQIDRRAAGTFERFAFGDRRFAKLERERDRVRRERDGRLVRLARRVPGLDSTGLRVMERAGLLVGVAVGVVWGVAGVVWDRARGQ
jgi:hypothetical protein